MLTNYELRRLALEALMSERTVRRAYDAPESIRESTRLRLSRAAKRLRLSPPPPARARRTVQ